MRKMKYTGGWKEIINKRNELAFGMTLKENASYKEISLQLWDEITWIVIQFSVQCMYICSYRYRENKLQDPITNVFPRSWPQKKTPRKCVCFSINDAKQFIDWVRRTMINSWRIYTHSKFTREIVDLTILQVYAGVK